MPSNTHWYLLLFTIGAASIAVEIAGLRLLAPLFGTSLPIWGAAIATVLAGLSVGYSTGGTHARSHASFEAVCQYGSFGAALFLWMPVAFQLALWLRTTGLQEGHPLLMIASFIFMLVMLFFPSVIFGMISPFAVQVEATRQKQPAGQVAGRISMISTLGSLFGILIPSFITIPFLGTRITVWLFAGSVLLLSAGSLMRSWRINVTAVSVALAVAFSSLTLINTPNILFADETEHQYVTVRQEGSNRILAFDANLGIQSLYTDHLYTRGYWDYLAALPMFSSKQNLSVAVLGAAASTTERQMNSFWNGSKQFSFTSVELDGDLFQIGDIYFHAPERRKVTSDARSFMSSETNTYDLIVIDVYSRELTVPFHLATQEFFQTIKQRLSSDGIVAINLNAANQDTIWIQSMARTVGLVFAEMRLAHIPASCNYLLLASNHALIPASPIPPTIEPLTPPLVTAIEPPTEGILLTDDRSPTDLLGFLALLPTMDEPAC